MYQGTNPAAAPLLDADAALDAAVPADVDVPALPAEVLLEVHDLDLDVLVPAAEWWRTATRRAARRLIGQMGPMLRHLVAEIVTLDRQLAETDNEVEQLRAELAELRAEVKELRAAKESAPAPDPDPLVAAHGMALRLSQALTPSPVSVSVDRYSWEDAPRVTVHADDAVSIEAWGVELCTAIQWTESSSGRSRMAHGECTIDGILVSLTGSVYLGLAAVAS
ncbi:hypothetical protein ACIQOW_08545 [Kitasatospora sp. NPDC091335]|uniref:hypothetical protein n=1 Tax=Kitasatospora sp. NPDC091335 TaxID=3364085 RepID=UPI00380AC37B